MAVKKATIMLSSILSLPILTTVTSCNTFSNNNVDNNVNNQFDHEDNGQIIDKDNNTTINKEEMKQIYNDIAKIKGILSAEQWNEDKKCQESRSFPQGPYICGSDFSTSQSLADIKVNQKITEKVINKIKELENHSADPVDLKNIKFIPELKSELFKADRKNYIVKNYVNLQVVYTKGNYQTSSTFQLEIKGVHQDLQEHINQAIDNLKSAVNFTSSFLLENDDLTKEKIKKEFIRVITAQMNQYDERITVKLEDDNQDLINNQDINITIAGKDETTQISEHIKIKLDKLNTVQDYIKNIKIKTDINITRADELYANIPGESYPNKLIEPKLFQMFKDINKQVLLERAITSFELIPNNSNVVLIEGDNKLTAKVQFEFNKSFADLKLTLHNVEKHPQVVVDTEANKMKLLKDIDLINEPIFTDSDFNLEGIKRQLLNKITEKIGVNKDIAIKMLSVVSSTSNSKKIRFEINHATIKTVNGIPIKSQQVEINFINIQKSPYQHLNERLNDLFSLATVSIDASEYDDLFVKNAGKKQFTDYEINTLIIPAVSKKFNQLQDRVIGVHLHTIDRPKNASKSLEFQFTFKRNGVTAKVSKVIEFKRK